MICICANTGVIKSFPYDFPYYNLSVYENLKRYVMYQTVLITNVQERPRMDGCTIIFGDSLLQQYIMTIFGQCFGWT